MNFRRWNYSGNLKYESVYKPYTILDKLPDYLKESNSLVKNNPTVGNSNVLGLDAFRYLETEGKRFVEDYSDILYL